MMFSTSEKLLIICALFLAAEFALANKEPKPRNIIVPAGQPGGRVYKGKNATSGQFPYQANLEFDAEDDYYWICSGSVIGNQWILTAAHCTEGAISGIVYLGGITLRTATVKYDVKKDSFIMHPGYITKTLKNDIALIRIPFTSFNDNIQLVYLPALSQANSTFVGEEAIVTGWGRYTATSRKSSPYLLWGNMTVISNGVCGKIYRILPTNICAIAADGVNTCLGDSGGPVVIGPYNHRIQVGITSSGPKCFLHKPAINTRISSYLEWIAEKTGIYY